MAMREKEGGRKFPLTWDKTNKIREPKRIRWNENQKGGKRKIKRKKREKKEKEKKRRKKTKVEKKLGRGGEKKEKGEREREDFPCVPMVGAR